MKKKLPQKGQREVPSLKKLHNDIPFERIIAEVAKAGNVTARDLQDRKTKLKDLRRMAMELCYRFSNAKQKEIGAIFEETIWSNIDKNRYNIKSKDLTLFSPSQTIKDERANRDTLSYKFNTIWNFFKGNSPDKSDRIIIKDVKKDDKKED